MGLRAETYSRLMDLLHLHRAKKIPLGAVIGWAKSQGIKANTLAAIWKMIFEAAKKKRE